MKRGRWSLMKCGVKRRWKDRWGEVRGLRGLQGGDADRGPGGDEYRAGERWRDTRARATCRTAIRRFEVNGGCRRRRAMPRAGAGCMLALAAGHPAIGLAGES